MITSLVRADPQVLAMSFTGNAFAVRDLMVLKVKVLFFMLYFCLIKIGGT